MSYEVSIVADSISEAGARITTIEEPSGLHNIYVLVDPRTEAIRYVGYSKYPPDRRLKWHLKQSRLGGNTHRCRWIRQLIAAGLMPVARLIEITDSPKAREIHWIATLKDSCNLTNETSGGDGRRDYVTSAETKAKLSEINTGKRLSQETVANMSLSRAGKPPLAAIEAVRGSKRSPETREKMSKAAKGRKFSDKTRSAIRATLQARPMTEDRLAQLAKARESRSEKARNKRLNDGLQG